MTNTQTDEELMILVKNGEIDYLSVLFTNYQERMYNFFLRMCRQKDVSEDLTQNLFYRILKYKHTYNEEYKFITWIYQMARNIFADHLKKRKLIYEETDERKWNIEPELDENIDKKAKYEALNHALMQLNEEQRGILIMSRFDDLKYREIAEIIGNTEGAVKVKVHRAIKKLKQIYFEKNSLIK